MYCNFAMEVMRMKRLQRVLSMLLATAMMASLGGFASAENTEDAQPIQADILSLMRPENAPKSTTIHMDANVPGSRRPSGAPLTRS